MASETPLTAEDRELLERVARRVVELRMEIPAILTLESARPLSLLAGQTMIFFEPLAQAMFPMPEYRRFAALVERREALAALADLIEERAEAARAARRAARQATPPRGPKPL